MYGYSAKVSEFEIGGSWATAEVAIDTTVKSPVSFGDIMFLSNLQYLLV